MHHDVIILVAEDNEGHANLIKKNLKRAGIVNEVLLFKDGQDIVNFLFGKGDRPHRKSGKAYILLLDIRMPKIDGVEVLKLVKSDPVLKKLPVIMITTTDDPREIENCHEMGCGSYITKPINYDNFVKAIRQLGLFLSIVEVPAINGE
jgi:CheY-like chemotaxis protein